MTTRSPRCSSMISTSRLRSSTRRSLSLPARLLTDSRAGAGTRKSPFWYCAPSPLARVSSGRYRLPFTRVAARAFRRRVSSCTVLKLVVARCWSSSMGSSSVCPRPVTRTSPPSRATVSRPLSADWLAYSAPYSWMLSTCLPARFRRLKAICAPASPTSSRLPARTVQAARVRVPAFTVRAAPGARSCRPRRGVCRAVSCRAPGPVPP